MHNDTERTTESTADGVGDHEIRRYALSERCRLVLTRGDITGWRGAAIVNAANERMLGGGGVDGAIHRAAGPRLVDACKQVPEVEPGVRCPVGEARLTPGFSLPAAHVIHTVGPRYRRCENPAMYLRRAYRNCLQLARKHELRRIAFPALSCGAFGYPLDEAANIALYTCKRQSHRFEEIWFVLFDAAAWDAWCTEAERLFIPPSTRAQASVPVVVCDTCGFRVTGLRCRGHRSGSARVRYAGDSYHGYNIAEESMGVRLPVPVSECGALLVASADGRRLMCPDGCGEVVLRCHKDHVPMQVEVDADAPSVEDIARVHANLGRAPDASPMATCAGCGHSVDGLLCVGSAHDGEPRPLPRNGFFERVWASYVWSCGERCARKPDNGGLFHGGSLACTKCAHDDSGSMPMLDYVERHGPPTN